MTNKTQNKHKNSQTTLLSTEKLASVITGRYKMY